MTFKERLEAIKAKAVKMEKEQAAREKIAQGKAGTREDAE